MASALDQITITTVADGERSCADLGITEPMVYLRNSVASECAMKQARNFDAAPLFAPGTEITVRVGRKKTVSGAWDATSGALVFTGKCILTPSSASGMAEQFVYQFKNAWHDFERIKYGQKWMTVKETPGASVGDPPVITPSFVAHTKFNLFTRTDLDTGAVTRITNGEQVRDAVQWAIDHGVNLQIGTITPALYLPSDAKRDLTVAEVIQMALKLSPDAVCEIDMTTTPPTFNCIQRAGMTDVVWNLSDRKMESLKITPRHDLLVPAVVLIYERTDEVDGKARVTRPTVDASPDLGDDDLNIAQSFLPNALAQTIALYGGKVTFVRGTVTTEDIPPADAVPDGGTGSAADYAPDDKQWWIDHGIAWLGNADYTDIVITPELRVGELPYILAPGSQTARWMKDDNGNARATENETFKAHVAYKAYGNQLPRQPISASRRTTNLASGDYTDIKSIENGEVAVAGTAALIHASLSTLFHDGEITVTEAECGTDLRLINTLSIAGGTNQFATMKAVVQEIALNLTNGQRSVTIGWPKLLSLAEIREIARMNRVRHVWNNPSLQGTGEFADDSEVELQDQGGEDDSASGLPSYSKLLVKEANQITHDAVNGRLLIEPAPVVTPSPGAKALTGTTLTGQFDFNLADTGGRTFKAQSITVCGQVNGVTGQFRVWGIFGPIESV